jgi:hypothetical protein
MTPINPASNLAGRRPAPAGLSFTPSVPYWQLGPLAIAYIRRSTPPQVIGSAESTDRSPLIDRAVEVGWPRENILVIDVAQGKSGSTAEDRISFGPLLREVGVE